MKPSFTQIAELFYAGGPEGTSPEPFEEGKDANESSAKGKARLQEGDFQQAIAHFRKAIEQRGAEDEADLLDLADAYAYGDAAPEALRQYERARRIADSAEAWVGIAQLHRQYGHHQEAVQDMERAIEKDPSNAFLHIRLAEMLAEAGFPKRAYALALKAVVLKPDESYYHHRAAELAAAMGDLEAAVGSFRAAIELSPGDDFLYARVASVFWRLGRHSDAVKALRLASDLDPDKERYRGLLYYVLRAAGQDEDAALQEEAADGLDRYDQDWVERFLAEAGIAL
jgi:tetratricopeptide (TPR) repeat protein